MGFYAIGIAILALRWTTFMKSFFAILATISLLIGVTCPATAQISAGQLDDFQQGGAQGWQEGASSPNPPQVISTGGPAGAGDAFLQNLSSGSGSAGGKMTVFNTNSRWRGNYIDAGITALEADLNNLGSTPLTIRFDLVRLDPMTNSQQVFTQGFELEPGSGWQRATFSLEIDDLFTSGDPAAILSDVRQLRIVHDPRATPSDPQPPVSGLLAIDNIRAVGAPVVEPLPGDYNGNGTVEQADLDLVLLNWGALGDPPPTGWVNDLPMGSIDQAELDGVLLNWGNVLAAAPAPVATAGVPEPAGLLLAGICGLLAAARMLTTGNR
jgi:hypothetical protein